MRDNSTIIALSFWAIIILAIFFCGYKAISFVCRKTSSTISTYQANAPVREAARVAKKEARDRNKTLSNTEKAKIRASKEKAIARKKELVAKKKELFVKKKEKERLVGGTTNLEAFKSFMIGLGIIFILVDILFIFLGLPSGPPTLLGALFL